MKRPSDKEIRKTVRRWVVAHARWMECICASKGPADRPPRITAEFAERREDRVKAEAQLLRMGRKLVAAKKAGA